MVTRGNKNQLIPTARNKWFLPVAVFIIAITSFSLYHKSVNNEFLDLDDMTFFVRNYSFIQHLSNAPKAFTQGVFQGEAVKDTGESYYRPMLILSFMLDAHFSPATPANPSPKPFLEANIVYHTIACVLLLLLLLELNISALSALLLALIFTVHPLLNQAVAWIPGRNDSLLSIFILLSLFSLFRYHKTKKTGAFFLHILFFVFALFTKENAVMFIPVVFILLRFVYKEPFPNADYKKLGIAYLLCIIPWIFIRQYSLASDHSISTPAEAMHNLLINSAYFIQYAGKAILPFNLSTMSTAADTNYFIALPAIALVAAGIYYSKEKDIKLLIFGISWFVLFITPTFASGYSGLEHRAYLPLMGLIIVVSQFDIVKKAGAKPPGIKHITGFIILFTFFIVFCVLSASRLYVFKNKYIFDKSAILASPKSTVPCLHLGKEYEIAADTDNAISLRDGATDYAAGLAAHRAAAEFYDSAVEAYRVALKRDSTLEMTHNDIAGVYIRMEMYPQAEKELQAELAKHPKNHIAVFNLGYVVLMGKRDTAQCIALLKKSISLDSSFIQPYQVLSMIYQSTGDRADAELYKNLYYKKNNNQ